MLRLAVAAIVSPLVILAITSSLSIAFSVIDKQPPLKTFSLDLGLGMIITTVAYIGMAVVGLPCYILVLRYRKPVPVWASALIGIVVVATASVFYAPLPITARSMLDMCPFFIVGALIGIIFELIFRATGPHLEKPALLD